MDEMELLKRYVEARDQTAFAELVRIHGDWVYSAARRQLGDTHMAEDVTQAVFALLARRGRGLREYAYLGGWLFVTLQYCVKEVRRREARQQRREQEAAKMRDEVVSDQAAEWEEIVPVLEDAVAGLGKEDREAVVLRFYEQKPLAEVGRAMGVGEDAARKRVLRATEKLRGMMMKRGVRVGAAALGVVLMEKATQAAPTGVVESVTGSAAEETGAIAKGVMKRMVWGKVKVAAVVGLVGAVGGVGVGLVTRGNVAAGTNTAATQMVANAVSANATEKPKTAGPSSATVREVYVTGMVPRQGVFGLPFADARPNLRELVLAAGVDLAETEEGQEVQVLRRAEWGKPIRIPARGLIASGTGDMTVVGGDLVIVAAGDGGSRARQFGWLWVHDIPAEVAFYRDVLGFEVTKPAETEMLEHAERVVMETGGSRLVIRDWRAQRGGGMVPAVMLQVRDIHGFRKELEQRGVAMGAIKSITDVYPQQLSCDGVDPEGHGFELLQYLEGPATTQATR